MNRKATSLAALVAAASIAAVPVSGAVAATVEPAAVALTTAGSTQTPASVLRSGAPATGASVVTGASTKTGSQSLAPIVVVTDEAVANESPRAAATAPSAVSLSDVPKAVTDILNGAGLPFAGVWSVVKSANGVYTVWYKLLTTVPNAILTGQWGSVPSIFGKAIDDSITWITTGAGPKVPETKASSAAATPAPTSLLSDVLNVAGIPLATAWAAVQTANTIYQNGYALLTSVPNAILTGKWGDVPTLISDFVTKSITAVVDFPDTQLKATGDKIDKLITSLAPATAEPTVKSADAFSALKAGAASDLASSSASDKAATDVTPVSEASKQAEPGNSLLGAKPLVEASKPVAEAAKPVAEASKPAVEPSKPAVDASEPVEEPSKPATEPTEPKPAAESKPAAETKTGTDSKSAESSAADSQKTAGDSAASEKSSASDSSAGSTSN